MEGTYIDRLPSDIINYIYRIVAATRIQAHFRRYRSVFSEFIAADFFTVRFYGPVAERLRSRRAAITIQRYVRGLGLFS